MIEKRMSWTVNEKIRTMTLQNASMVYNINACNIRKLICVG